MKRIQHRRFTSAAAGYVATLGYGELAVNPFRREVLLGDSDGTARTVVGVRPFDARSDYVAGEFVVQAGVLYRANGAISAGAFDAGEWTQHGHARSDLETHFDTQYAALGHNHDAVYSPLAHNHNGVYSPIAHNHDGTYAPVVHTHDDRYGQLTAGNNWTGVNNFTNVVNAQGSYVAVYGSLSVGGGGFVPSIPLHVRASSLLYAQLEATTASQVRLGLKNTNREHLFYLEATGVQSGIYDLSSGHLLQSWQSGQAGSTINGTVTIGGALVPTGGIFPIGGLTGSGLGNEAGNLVLRPSSSPNTALVMNGTQFVFWVNNTPVVTIDSSGIANLPFKKHTADGNNVASIQVTGMQSANYLYMVIFWELFATGPGASTTFILRLLDGAGATIHNGLSVALAGGAHNWKGSAVVTGAYNIGTKMMATEAHAADNVIQAQQALAGIGTATVGQVQALCSEGNITGSIRVMAFT